MSQWITHDGKGCPVDYRTIVKIRCRDGVESMVPQPAVLFQWRNAQHFTDNSHIIAYQVIEPYTKPNAATVTPPATPPKKS